jgi:hypothetical protein
MSELSLFRSGLGRSGLGRSGLVCLVTGIVGAALAGLLLAWPTEVDDSLLRYPFSENGFLTIQAVFAVHHLGLVVGVVALALSGAVGTRWWARGGAWLLFAGTVMLTGSELLTMRYVDWTSDAANAGLMGAAYGISCTVMGIGAILAGAGVLRAKVWSGWRAWTPMVIGVAQFVMLTPGMFGGFVVARLVIGAWMLMFAALGWSLYAESRGEVRTGTRARAVPVG